MAALKGDKEHGDLWELLGVFTKGKLKDYRAFTSAHPAVLSKYSLDADLCVNNMRLLTMCSLATEHEEIPYAAIAKDLEVEQSEVEGWVAATISAQLVDAKMDQIAETVNLKCPPCCCVVLCSLRHLIRS